MEVTTNEGDKITPYLLGLFAVCFLANVFGGTVSVLMSVYLPVAVHDLVGDLDAEKFNYVSAYVNSVFIFGWTLGGIVWGIYSDRMGRSKAIILSIGFFGVFTLLTGFTNSWWLVMICRFLSGFGVGGVLVATPTILSEVWPEKTRSIFIGILSIGFPVGIFSAGLIDLFVSNWHQAFTVGLIPLTLSLLSIPLVRESEKWALEKTVGEGTLHKLTSVFSRSHLNDLLVGSLTFGTMLVGLWAIFSWVPSWAQDLSSSSDGQQERGLTMMLMGAGGLTGGFFSGWLANALGHRRAMMVCFAGCALLSFVIFKMNTVFSEIIYFEIAILALFFGASQGILSGYIPGLFPPAFRATATGFCFNIGRIFTGCVVFFIGALVTALGGYGNAIFTFSLVFVIGLIATYFSKEVK